MKTRKNALTIISVIIIGFLLTLGLYGKTIFQRGNPIPYLLASTRIDADTPYIEVGNNSGIYISKRGDCPQFLEFIEKSEKVEFVEQGGNSYLFAHEDNSLTVYSENYWKWFTVWKVSK